MTSNCAQPWFVGSACALLSQLFENYRPPLSNAKEELSAIRWFTGEQTVRGVNLGSQFILEPWMAYDEWQVMGCGDLIDEWECVQELGQVAADAAWSKHWETWITKEDIANISSLGLNVVRVPVGFWMKEDLVYDGEHYPRGALPHLDKLIGWAADQGLHVIIDLHAAPGVQSPQQPFTGHIVESPGFYTSDNFERAWKFLEWMTNRIHTNKNYRTTGVLQVVNEPIQSSNYPAEAADMVRHFYPEAYHRIRATETTLGVHESDRLKIMYMGESWGAGNPTSFLLGDTSDLLFDDHPYFKWDESVKQTKGGYISAACSMKGNANNTIAGECSMGIHAGSRNTSEFAIGAQAGDNTVQQKLWYSKFWAAQAERFERNGGWIFWSWKCSFIDDLDDFRWCYQSAIENGVIPRDAAAAAAVSPCT